MTNSIEAPGEREAVAKEQWIKRFVTRMIDRAGFDHFDDGMLVLDYAYETAPAYWEDPFGETPEDCADADMSYWGEE